MNALAQPDMFGPNPIIGDDPLQCVSPDISSEWLDAAMEPQRWGCPATLRDLLDEMALLLMDRLEVPIRFQTAADRYAIQDLRQSMRVIAHRLGNLAN